MWQGGTPPGGPAAALYAGGVGSSPPGAPSVAGGNRNLRGRSTFHQPPFRPDSRMEIGSGTHDVASYYGTWGAATGPDVGQPPLRGTRRCRQPPERASNRLQVGAPPSRSGATSSGGAPTMLPARLRGKCLCSIAH